MYSSEYTSGFFRPAALHLAAPLSPRHEGNVGQAPSLAHDFPLLQEPQLYVEMVAEPYRD
jgi:hypothetical protein